MACRQLVEAFLLLSICFAVVLSKSVHENTGYGSTDSATEAPPVVNTEATDLETKAAESSEIEFIESEAEPGDALSRLNIDYLVESEDEDDESAESATEAPSVVNTEAIDQETRAATESTEAESDYVKVPSQLKIIFLSGLGVSDAVTAAADADDDDANITVTADSSDTVTTEPQTTPTQTTPCSRIDDKCLDCICEKEGCRSQIGKCRIDAGSLSCGPFQIKRSYWIDCGKPEGDYEKCTKQMECSRRCAIQYMKRYASRCTNPRQPTCSDYGRVHNGGPKGCLKQSTINYGRDVKSCHDKP